MKTTKIQPRQNNSMYGYVHSTESFGAVDGPGIRFVIFLQGCRMRCRYCHNPDTWKMGVGSKRTAKQLLNEAERYRQFWGDRGGITVSGGEPLLQIEFVFDLFRIAKMSGIHTCLDTSGQPFTRTHSFLDKFCKLMTVTDLVLVDIKEINESKHRKLTGYPNNNVLDMCQFLSDTGKPVWIRHVLVPQWTDFNQDLMQLEAFIHTLKNVEKIEVLPYHTMGVVKYKQMGLRNPLQGIDPPTTERIRHAEQLLHTSEK